MITKQLIRKLDSKIEYLWREYSRFQIVAATHPDGGGQLQRAFRNLENVQQQCVDLIGKLTSALPDIPPSIHLADDDHMLQRTELAQASTLLGRASAAVINIKQGAEEQQRQRERCMAK